ncbi:hypothetical protein [Caballeronia sp. GAWG1-1]|uniref:hypothetical protein n=1 Tax=Caballeronia sp. GAWG1-1 TaxID=2921742 RepID=UPI002027D68D|nr:hypothetical protein [Caballeronia sp. GAWG1-1]
MIDRRRFLASLGALSGTYTLAACGGGSESDVPNSTSSASGRSRQLNPTARAESQGPSPDGTTIPDATAIVDKRGSVWTVNNGVVFQNDTAISIANVLMLLWSGGKIYQRNTSGQFYVWSNDWLLCRDPRTPLAAQSGMFFGMNGHYDYLYTPAQTIAILNGMGCSIYRLGCNETSAELRPVARMARAMNGTGIELFCLIQQGLTDDWGNLFGSEAAAYAKAYSTGVTVASTLKPYGVTMYECGNELTRRAQTVIDSNRAGTDVADFNNDNWPVMRGVMRGLIDGVKAAQPDAMCGINFCVADIGASDALWEGNQPDGTSGHPVVRWDMTTWHNYEVYGDLFDIGSDGAGPHFDLPQYCKARYGVPFMITEWNANPEQSDDYRSAFVQSRLQSFYDARKTHNIQSTMYYVLDSGDHTFGIMHNSVPILPTYLSFVNFVRSHADF